MSDLNDFWQISQKEIFQIKSLFIFQLHLTSIVYYLAKQTNMEVTSSVLNAVLFLCQKTHKTHCSQLS